MEAPSCIGYSKSCSGYLKRYIKFYLDISSLLLLRKINNVSNSIDLKHQRQLSYIHLYLPDHPSNQFGIRQKSILWFSTFSKKLFLKLINKMKQQKIESIYLLTGFTTICLMLHHCKLLRF